MTPGSNFLLMLVAVFLFSFMDLIERSQARERHRLIVPQHIKTVHRTHQTQYARAYGYESQLKHLKAVGPIAQSHKLGIKSRAGPPLPPSPPVTTSSRSRPIRTQNPKQNLPRGQSSRGDPQLYKRPGPAPGLKRIPTRQNVAPPPKLTQYKNPDSLEQYAPNFQNRPSKYQKHLYEEHGGVSGGLPTSYQILQSGNNQKVNSKFQKHRHSNRIPYVDETVEDESLGDYDEPETHRLSASQNRGAYRKPPGSHLKENSFELEYGANRYSRPKENLYALPQQSRRPSEEPIQPSPIRTSSSSSSSPSSFSEDTQIPNVESAYRSAYLAFSHRKNRNNLNTTPNHQSQAVRGEYTGVNSYGDPVAFDIGGSKNNNSPNKNGDHDIGFGEGLV